MRYERNVDLPENLQRLLPEHAQDIYHEAFNHAYAAHVGEIRQEEAAHSIAWAAVKWSYIKTSAGWVRRGEIG
nr:ChaB family protein [Methylocystis rosea]